MLSYHFLGCNKSIIFRMEGKYFFSFYALTLGLIFQEFMLYLASLAYQTCVVLTLLTLGTLKKANDYFSRVDHGLLTTIPFIIRLTSY